MKEYFAYQKTTIQSVEEMFRQLRKEVVQKFSSITTKDKVLTIKEAAEYLKRFGTAGKFYLVTDATHMPRAMMHFRNAGLQPIAAPTNFYSRRNKIPLRFIDYFPSSGSIRNMEMVCNEYLGMLWGRMGGN